MPQMISKLNVARLLLVIGLLAGARSLLATFSHIGDPLFTLPVEFGGGTNHSWYHALREGVGDIATIVILLLIFFGASKFRTAGTWWIALIAMVGYYAPFWVGMPFNSALAAPSIGAELWHITQAALPLLGLWLARNEFFGKPNH